MKKLILFLIAATLIGLLIWRFVERGKIETTLTIAQMQAEKGYPVHVEQVQTGAFRLTKTYSGTVVGGKQSTVISQISEHVVAVHVVEGQFVKKDQLICELSRSNPLAGYNIAKLALENADLELTRMSSLLDDGAVSQQGYDVLLLQRDMAQENLSAAEQFLYIRSPFGGQITELTAESGKLVSAGEPLAKVVSTLKPRVEIIIPAADRSDVKVGAPAVLKSGRSKIHGRVKRISLSADPEARSFTAWIHFDNKSNDFAFSPGLLVDVSVEIVSLDDATLISPDALMRIGDEFYVYIVDESRAYLKQVELGGQNNRSVWLRSGVNPNQEVVVSGAALLEDGALVRITGR